MMMVIHGNTVDVSAHEKVFAIFMLPDVKQHENNDYFAFAADDTVSMQRMSPQS